MSTLAVANVHDFSYLRKLPQGPTNTYTTADRGDRTLMSHQEQPVRSYTGDPPEAYFSQASRQRQEGQSENCSADSTFQGQRTTPPEAQSGIQSSSSGDAMQGMQPIDSSYLSHLAPLGIANTAQQGYSSSPHQAQAPEQHYTMSNNHQPSETLQEQAGANHVQEQHQANDTAQEQADQQHSHQPPSDAQAQQQLDYQNLGASNNNVENQLSASQTLGDPTQRHDPSSEQGQSQFSMAGLHAFTEHFSKTSTSPATNVAQLEHLINSVWLDLSSRISTAAEYQERKNAQTLEIIRQVEAHTRSRLAEITSVQQDSWRMLQVAFEQRQTIWKQVKTLEGSLVPMDEKLDRLVEAATNIAMATNAQAICDSKNARGKGGIGPVSAKSIEAKITSLETGITKLQATCSENSATVVLASEQIKLLARSMTELQQHVLTSIAMPRAAVVGALTDNKYQSTYLQNQTPSAHPQHQQQYYHHSQQQQYAMGYPNYVEPSSTQATPRSGGHQTTTTARQEALPITPVTPASATSARPSDTGARLTANYLNAAAYGAISAMPAWLGNRVRSDSAAASQGVQWASIEQQQSSTASRETPNTTRETFSPDSIAQNVASAASRARAGSLASIMSRTGGSAEDHPGHTPTARPATVPVDYVSEDSTTSSKASAALFASAASNTSSPSQFYYLNQNAAPQALDQSRSAQRAQRAYGPAGQARTLGGHLFGYASPEGQAQAVGQNQELNEGSVESLAHYAQVMLAQDGRDHTIARTTNMTTERPDQQQQKSSPTAKSTEHSPSLSGFQDRRGTAFSVDTASPTGSKPKGAKRARAKTSVVSDKDKGKKKARTTRTATSKAGSAAAKKEATKAERVEGGDMEGGNQYPTRSSSATSERSHASVPERRGDVTQQAQLSDPKGAEVWQGHTTSGSSVQPESSGIQIARNFCEPRPTPSPRLNLPLLNANPAFHATGRNLSISLPQSRSSPGNHVENALGTLVTSETASKEDGSALGARCEESRQAYAELRKEYNDQEQQGAGPNAEPESAAPIRPIPRRMRCIGGDRK